MYFFQKKLYFSKDKRPRKKFFNKKLDLDMGKKTAHELKNPTYPYGDINFLPYNPWVNL